METIQKLLVDRINQVVKDFYPISKIDFEYSENYNIVISISVVFPVKWCIKEKEGIKIVNENSGNTEFTLYTLISENIDFLIDYIIKIYDVYNEIEKKEKEIEENTIKKMEELRLEKEKKLSQI